ncbi:MAG TPA: DUF4011 domain-containing protein, partial [Kofleriaceae bacterium]|nr:DUF4011 domain-containing protein [Kofleriaceae bacterium]
DIDPAARARIDRWKLSLLDLTAGNRLLDAKDGRTCIRMPDVDPVRIASVLAAGQVIAVEAGAPVAIETGRLHAPLAATELDRRLVAIRRTARANLADGGVHTLWLGLGALVWLDGEGQERTAPLVMYPVELERSAGGSLRLVPAEREPRINATLVEKLRRDFDVAIADDTDLVPLFEALDGIAVTRPGWRVERSAHLGIFSFAKLTMWHDLDRHADSLMESPVVAQLASATGEAFANPSELPPPITEVLAPLDADGSQLAAIAAAGAGHSFVLQGPPGTGKSQTIANLIVHCVGQGKSVLFVTEKMAALEVVHQRLASVGLGELCLELHSHKAKRADVLASLGRVLERAFRPGAVPAGADTRLVELRGALDGHVTALHACGVFGRSLHEVLGRLVELREVTPTVVAAERDAAGLDRQTFERRKVCVEQLAAAAIPIEPIATHPWRASALERFPLDGRDRVVISLDELATAIGDLSAALASVQALVPGLLARTSEQLVAVGALATLAAASPRPGTELLTQLRGPRDVDIGERIALIRAKGGGTIEVPRDPASFLVLAYRHRMLHDEVAGRFTDAVAALDAPALWAQLRKWSGRLAPLRYMALRTIRAEIRAAAIPGQLETDAAMITVLEAVIAERAARTALAGAAEPAARWFGELGGDPLALDLSKIDAAVAWAAELRKAFDATSVGGGEAGRQSAWRALVAQVAAGESLDLSAFAKLGGAVGRWQPAVAALAEATGIAVADLATTDADHLIALRERIDTLRGAIDSLRDWVQLHNARRAAVAAGVGAAVAALDRGDIGAGELATAWERATLLAWADAELAAAAPLAQFHGTAHHAHVSSFADLDRSSLGFARARAVVKLAERIPRVVGLHGVGPEPGGELGTLLHEIKKQRGHRPLRALFADIPTLLPRLAPCLLMSPQSVAQYLEPNLLRF